MPRSADDGRSSRGPAGAPAWPTRASVPAPGGARRVLTVAVLLVACTAPPPFTAELDPGDAPALGHLAGPAPATTSLASSAIKPSDAARLIARHEAAEHAGDTHADEIAGGTHAGEHAEGTHAGEHAEGTQAGEIAGGTGAGEHAESTHAGEIAGGTHAPAVERVRGSDAVADSFAHPEITAEMRADLRAPRHPADGGGRAWIEGHADGSRSSVPASSRAQFPIIFEVGPRGIATGGTITLQVSPFWGWDTPQVVDPLAPGFTQVTTRAVGVELSPETLGPQLLGIRVAGRALAPGEQVRIDYGAGEAQARVDRFAENGSRFWIGVDGDADGVRKLIHDPPAVDVRAGRPALLVAALPGTARPGEEIVLHLAVLDGAGNAGTDFIGRVAIALAPDSDPATLTYPSSVTLGTADRGRKSVPVRVRGEGVARLVATAYPATETVTQAPDHDSRAGGRTGGPIEASDTGTRMPSNHRGRRGAAALAPESARPTNADTRAFPPAVEARGLQAETNPLVIDSALDATLLWADLQVHSQISDGSGTPDEIFTYGRDVAGLDVVAITDHDHWGLEFLDATPHLWQTTLASVARHHRDGGFVTLPGFEWTNWEQGHRHVLFFNPTEARVISSLDAATDRPDELWQALAGSDAITIAHHSAGGPVPIDWSFMPPAKIEPVTEIASVHGSSEAADTPGPIYHPKPNNTVRDALARGHRLGFVGSSDGHDGHPGLSQIAGGHSGVAGLWVRATPARTREAVRDTLRARRTYATNGPRIFVEAALDGWPMGADLPADYGSATPGSAAADAGGQSGSKPSSNLGTRPAPSEAAALQPVPSPRSALLEWRIAATAPIERIDVIRGNGRIGRVKGEGERDTVGAVEVVPLAPGEWLYLRIVQSDGGAAWTSPFFAPLTGAGDSPSQAAAHNPADTGRTTAHGPTGARSTLGSPPEPPPSGRTSRNGQAGALRRGVPVRPGEQQVPTDN